jgi:hypothetical protein
MIKRTVHQAQGQAHHLQGQAQVLVVKVTKINNKIYLNKEASRNKPDHRALNIKTLQYLKITQKNLVQNQAHHLLQINRNNLNGNKIKKTLVSNKFVILHKRSKNQMI